MKIIYRGKVFFKVSKILVLILVCICYSINLLAEERSYPNIIALGYGIPLTSDEGLTTPIVVFDHESSGYFGGGTLRLKYQTVSPYAGMTHRLNTWFNLGYAIYGTIIAEGNGSDIYLNGVLLKDKTFSANGGSVQMRAYLFPKAKWRITIEADYRHRYFYASNFTPNDYQFPNDFQEQKLSGEMKKAGLIHPEGEFRLKFSSGNRHNWVNWELDTFAVKHKKFSRSEMLFKDHMDWNEINRSTLHFYALGGQNLDLFSNFNIGGLISDYSVAGFFRNEYRTSSAQLLKYRHEIEFAEDRILYLFADAASFEELDLDYLNETPDSRKIAGMGAGFRYGIRKLMGLPLIVSYGKGLNVPEGSKEQDRHELVFALAAGF